MSDTSRDGGESRSYRAHTVDSLPVSEVVVSKKEQGAPGSSPVGGTEKVAPGWLKKLAITTGLLGLLMFLLTPFMPVNQVQSSVSWPQNDELSSINAPLISYAPQSLEATIPLTALENLYPGQTLVFGTLPPDSTDATNRGLFVRTIDGGLDVVVTGEVLLELPESEVEDLPTGAMLEITSTGDSTTAEITGTDYLGETDEDARPHVTGVYTELVDDPATYSTMVSDGLAVDVEVNSRFTSSPSVIKYIVMWTGLLLTLASLWALHRMDILDGRRVHRFLPANWYRVKPLDGVVAFVLVFWHFLGANTSDDGFIMNMARVSHNADYMANYYRWFGVPESPFGAPFYDLLAVMSY